MTDFIQTLLDTWDGNEPNNMETMFYWDELLKDIGLYADPKYNKTNLSDHFNNIITWLCTAERNDGFKQGIAFAMRLTAESFATPAKNRHEMQQEYAEHIYDVKENAKYE